MAQAARPIRPGHSAKTLERVGGIAALLTTAVLFFGLVGLFTLQQGLWNWLVVLFMMNAGLSPHLPPDPLQVLNPVDVAALALVSLTFLGLWPVLGPRHRIWTGIAIALPFIGILLLLVTGLQGRSAVMGAGLVIAALMFLGGSRGRLLASIGIVANGLLLAGDVGTGVVTGGLAAAAVGIGYVLLLGWYVLLALHLLGRRPLRPALNETDPGHGRGGE